GVAAKAQGWPTDIKGLEALRERSPENALVRFRLGVAYRQRFDSKERQPGDFKEAITFWKEALALDPDQYIWRRRIQQYGPRLDKPYSFYDWAHQAREEITARGEKSHSLMAEPRGSEFAHPGAGEVMAEQVHPDPEGKVTRDGASLVNLRAVVVPSTKGDGKALRVHLHFLPDSKKLVHWSNDVGPLSFFIEEGQEVVIQDQSIGAAPKGIVLSSEERVVEFEIRSVGGKALPKTLKGSAFYFVCEDENGTCQYLRQDVELEL
ncbi:MAG: tetratricopeptide repeat protein, partial [Akkermansiaceae bacterium]